MQKRPFLDRTMENFRLIDHVMMLKNSRGFTAKELVMVIVVIAILCLLSVPPFFALQNSHRRTEMEKTIMELNGKIAALKKDSSPLPLSFDANPLQSPCLKCFESFIKTNGNNPLWYKFSGNIYLYSVNGNHGTVTDYQEPGDFKVEYDLEKGELKVEEIR